MCYFYTTVLSFPLPQAQAEAIIKYPTLPIYFMYFFYVFEQKIIILTGGDIYILNN